MSKDGEVDSSLSERPGPHCPRRLVDWLNPTGARKVHSLIDKVYKRKNLEIAWERVRANQGAGGIDGESIVAFGERCEERLAKLHAELRTGSYRPSPVRQQRIPKAGKPGEWRVLGIPTVYDRVCQQALLNRLEPIFEPIFDDANFGYRRGRSTKDAMRKVWKEIQSGQEWIVDGDLKDFFGSDAGTIARLVAEKPGPPPPELLEQYPAILTHTHNWRFSGNDAAHENFEQAEAALVTWCARLRIRAVGVGSAWDPASDAMFNPFEGPDR